ncbi:hypothetical protein L7F22_043233 [Adiantum nelumboides]|nr:hypothetical protein [Adiantum nelumboides]
MLSVLRVHLPSDIPIVGCELTPYVLLRRPDGSITPDDIPESSPVDGFYLKHRWYRIQSDKGIAVCNVHPSEPATLQCLGCIKAKTVSKSYHCSPECFADSWRQHRSLHARAANAVQENGPEEEELFGSFTGGSSVGSAVGAALLGLSNGSIPVLVSDRGGVGETWYEVGRSRTYTPSADDVGHVLKLECTAIDSSSGQPVAPASTLLTSRVIPAPSPTPRRMIPLSYMDGMSGLDVESHSSAAGTFTVLSYNVLADLYATSDMYSYCPPWALSWAYRRQNLLREIVGYRADILCLQEVQSDHFDEFFQPELEKHGYVAVYKKKATEDPLPMVFGVEDALDKIGDEMTAKIFKERLLLDNTLLLHQHLPPLSQVDKDYAPFVMVITGDKGKQAVRAVRVSKVVSTLMLNANTNVSVRVNLSNQVLSLLGFVGKHPLNVLVDNGFSTNFVSTTLVNKLRLATQQSVEAFQVELADGSYLQCNKKVQQLEFQIQDYQDQLGFSVMPLSHYDMILGQSWLYQYDPIISFRDHSIWLFHRNQEVELRGLFNTQPITMVSAMQVKRLVRKRDCTTALVMLREAEDDTEIQGATTPRCRGQCRGSRELKTVKNLRNQKLQRLVMLCFGQFMVD